MVSPNKASREGRVDLLLVSSSGGHLAHLLAVPGLALNRKCLWVTFSDGVSDLEARGERAIEAHSPTNRNIVNLIRNTVLALQVLRSCRPRAIVSTGAGVALPFFLLGRLFRAKLIYLEVFDRIDSKTLTGTICKPLCHEFLVQWPEQVELYGDRAKLVGPIL
jgi:hypothetical protein